METIAKTKLNSNAQAVLNIVLAAHNHPTALEIYEAVKSVRPHMGLASVYRILHNLAEQGYIREIGRDEEGNRYDGNTARHDHAVCTNCGALLDIPVEVKVPADALEQAARAAGIELGSYEVRLYGLCPSCSMRTI
ncbi:MAG TPA: transcriptional repressor [Ktedonobacteraceae bacterium]|jgi:Fur family peroxide stress response transcriptional regulator|nr:transcriptional repressor [Ktedonobacteraceae bacterium]